MALAVSDERIRVPVWNVYWRVPVVLLLGGQTDRVTFDVISSVKQVVLVNPAWGGRGRRGRDAMDAVVERLYVRAGKGELHVDDTTTVLGPRDELVLSDGSYVMRHADEKESGVELVIEGSGETVIVNGALRNHSAWNSMSAELRSVFVSVVVSALVSVGVSRRRRWVWGGSG